MVPFEEEAFQDAGHSHLIGNQEKTWHQRFRLAQTEGWGQRFPLSFVNVPFSPHQTLAKQNRIHLAVGGRFYPEVPTVQDVGDSLGVGNPQTIFLFIASPVKTRNTGRMDVWFSKITYPKRPIPTHDAAVCGQIMVLEASCFSIQQKWLMPYNASRSPRVY